MIRGKITYKIVLEEKPWTLPDEIDNMKLLQLAKRVRFEANNVIRLLTKDNRDILFLIVPEEDRIEYLSDVQVTNVFEVDGHKLTTKPKQGVLADMIQKNR